MDPSSCDRVERYFIVLQRIMASWPQKLLPSLRHLPWVSGLGSSKEAGTPVLRNLPEKKTSGLEHVHFQCRCAKVRYRLLLFPELTDWCGASAAFFNTRIRDALGVRQRSALDDPDYDSEGYRLTPSDDSLRRALVPP